MDLTTLAVLGSLFFGLVVSNAAFLGNSLYVNITVPSGQVPGISQAAAESIFTAEINRYAAPRNRLQSLIPTPSVDTSSTASLPMAIARPLKLDEMVYAVQSGIRNYGVVSVTASVVNDRQAPGLSMFMVVSNPPDPPVAMSLTRDDGNPKALIENAARETMVQIAPYEVAMVDFSDGIGGEAAAFQRCRSVVARGLAQPWDPRTLGATETALLYNVDGLLAVHDGRLDDAAQDFARGRAVPGANPAAYAAVALNQAFTAIAQREPEQAAARYNEGAPVLLALSDRDVQARVTVLGGLVAWSQGDLLGAEQAFRRAVALADTDEVPHAYLAELLAARNDAAGAAAEQRAGEEARRYDPKFPMLAHTIFRLDPVHGGYKPLS